jgi:hypothetical protein
MPFHPRPRLSSVLASVLAAGFMLTGASCSHMTPLGPDAVATLPPPHQLRSPLVVQVMQIQAPASAGSCTAGEVALSGGGNPTATCYRKTDTATAITSAAVSPVSSFQPPTPPGQQTPPVQYGFWITVPAADAPALTAVITVVTGPQGPQGSQDPPTSRVTNAALTVRVADSTWVLVGFTIRSTGREFDVFLSSRNQALQLQRALAPSG